MVVGDATQSVRKVPRMKTLQPSEKSSAALHAYGIDAAMVHGIALCRYDSGEILLKQGAPVEHLYLVLHGKIKIRMLAANGKDLTLCYYISSGILGDVELVQEDKSASATSIVVLPSDCIRIPLTRNWTYLHHNIVFMNQVAKGLSTKLLNSSNEHVSSALYSSEERLCSYILMAAHNNVFSDTLTDVSKSIGISYRHLFRLLSHLCQNGVLEKREAGFVISDKRYLLERCTHA